MWQGQDEQHQQNLDRTLSDHGSDHRPKEKGLKNRKIKLYLEYNNE